MTINLKNWNQSSTYDIMTSLVYYLAAVIISLSDKTSSPVSSRLFLLSIWLLCCVCLMYSTMTISLTDITLSHSFNSPSLLTPSSLILLYWHSQSIKSLMISLPWLPWANLSLLSSDNLLISLIKTIHIARNYIYLIEFLLILLQMSVKNLILFLFS